MTHTTLLSARRTKLLAIAAASVIVLVVFTAQIADAATCSTDSATALHDPLCTSNIYDFVQRVLEAFVAISIPILSFFIIYAGFKYVLARGNPGELSKAHENFKWLVIGAALILGAWSLAVLIKNTVNDVRGTSQALETHYVEYV